MNHLKLILTLIALYSLIFTQSAQINKISIEEKANGTLIRMGVDNPISYSQITGWTSNTGWFYVTLLGSEIDTTRQWFPIQTGIVSEFHAHQFTHSIQLDFRLTRKIESFEINVLEANNEVVIFVRLPITETVGVLQKLKDLESDEFKTDESTSLSYNLELKTRLPFALLLVGGGLITSGFLQSNGVEFLIGSAMLVTGYFLIINAESKKNSSIQNTM